MRRRSVAAAVTAAALGGLWAANLGGGCPGTSTGTGGFTFNLPPTVVITADLIRGIAPLTVQFDSSNSSDDGLIISRTWNFDDGQTSREIAPRHTFLATGQYNVTLTLVDDQGASASRSVLISVTLAPQARIIVDRTAAPSAPAVFNFDGSSSFDTDGEIVSFEWEFGDGSGEVEPVVPHVFGRPGTYRVRLTVTDDTGVTDDDEVIIEVGIPRPTITFRSPPPEITNLVVTAGSPLWLHAVSEVEPGVPRTFRAGLDRDRDACDANASLFDLDSGAELRMLTGHDEPVSAVAFSPDGRLLATGSADRTVRIYDVDTGLLLQTIGGHTAAINAVAFSADGSQILTGSDDNTAILHSSSSGETQQTFVAQADVTSVAFAPVGNAVLVGVEAINDPNVPVSQQPLAVLFDAISGAPEVTFRGHTGNVTSVAFSPDGAIVLTGSVDKTARLWDSSSGDEILALTGHTNTVTSVAFHSDAAARRVLTGSSDFSVRLWNADTGEQLRSFTGHTDRVTSVAFSPDGELGISGGADGTARVWNLQTGQPVRSVSSCRSAVSSVAVSPDGGTLAAGVAAQNSIQLDSLDRPSGNDLNLQVPVALDLSGVPDGERYFLWVEVDTDRTEPTRTYSHVQVNVTAPFTALIEDQTPLIVYGQDNSAAVIPPRGSGRGIVSLGELKQGDRIHLSLLNTPGYEQVFTSLTDFSVLILDNSTDPNDPTTLQPEMLAWYKTGFTLFTRSTRLVVGHDATYYLVLDGNPDTQSPTPAVNIRIEADFGLTPRAQQVYLNFRGGSGISVTGLPPFDIPPFDAGDVKTGWGATETATLKTGILQMCRDLYVNADGDPLNIEFISSDDADPPGPNSLSLYFGGDSIGGLFAFGIADYLDPRNDTLTGNGVVFTNDLGNLFYPSLTVEEMGDLIGRVAVHEAGHLLGLRHVDNDDDVMGFGDLANPQTFLKSPLTALEQFNAQIGFQNAPRYLEEILGLAPQP